MSDCIWYIVDRIWPPLIAVFLTLTFMKLRMPKLKISPEERTPILNGTFYAWRFLIKNQKSMNWLPIRETAMNCQAKIEVFEETKDVFKMKGRWVSSTEIPHFAEHDRLRIILHPETVSIRSGKNEPLDGIVQFPDDKVAYGWNNESYFNNWKTPAYKLEKGQYRVVVTVSPQNGHEKSEEFRLYVSENLDETSLTK